MSQLHKTERQWQNFGDWVPEAGEIVVYDPDKNYEYARLKIGDGKKQLSELPFFVDAAAKALISTLDAGRITDY